MHADDYDPPEFDCLMEDCRQEREQELSATDYSKRSYHGSTGTCQGAVISLTVRTAIRANEHNT